MAIAAANHSASETFLRNGLATIVAVHPGAACEALDELEESLYVGFLQANLRHSTQWGI
jgi:hypothetical protein